MSVPNGPPMPHPDLPHGLEGHDVLQTAIIGRDVTPADADVADEVELPPIGGFLGRCRVRAHMAAGRNSAIFRGELWDLHLPVAIKVLTPRRRIDRPVLAAQLRNEFMMLSRLTHANIARLWDYRDDPERPHLATEYVDSLTLDHLRISHGGRISCRLAIRIALKTLDALESAWRLGIVHRDVKPENLLFTPDGSVKAIDWGMAAFVGEEQPVPAPDSIRFLGTPAYLPPEMARPGRPFDHRADMYSLGSTLYHLITGRLPFAQKDPTRMVLAHLTETPIPPFDFVQEPGILRLSDVILRLMEKSPADRFQGADDLREELQRAYSEDTAGASRFVQVR